MTAFVTDPVDPPAARPAPARPGFFDRFSDRQMSLGVILFGLLLYVPLAGTYGLYDPWETHYGEVARQMTVRGDAISLWWPGSPIDPDHFWSKPVLTFWIMSLFMHLFGLGHADGASIALGTRAEWAMRLPFCLMGVLGIWAVYLCASRFAGRRAGVIAALVLATSPLYFLIARQAMTGKIGVMTGREYSVRDLDTSDPKRGEKMREAQSHASRQIDRTTQKKSSSRLRTRAFPSARSLLILRVCSA